MAVVASLGILGTLGTFWKDIRQAWLGEPTRDQKILYVAGFVCTVILCLVSLLSLVAAQRAWIKYNQRQEIHIYFHQDQYYPAPQGEKEPNARINDFYPEVSRF